MNYGGTKPRDSQIVSNSDQESLQHIRAQQITAQQGIRIRAIQIAIQMAILTAIYAIKI